MLTAAGKLMRFFPLWHKKLFLMALRAADFFCDYYLWNYDVFLPLTCRLIFENNKKKSYNWQQAAAAAWRWNYSLKMIPKYNFMIQLFPTHQHTFEIVDCGLWGGGEKEWGKQIVCDENFIENMQTCCVLCWYFKRIFWMVHEHLREERAQHISSISVL